MGLVLSYLSYNKYSVFVSVCQASMAARMTIATKSISKYLTLFSAFSVFIYLLYPISAGYNKLMTLLYILYSPIYKAIKIGISDVSGRRFASHRQKGWVVIKYWWFSERDQARAVESLVLDTLRTKYGHFLDKADMPQGGYTETFDASKITRRGLVRMVNNAISKSLEFGAK